MTVCIATIHSEGMLGIADRMLTGGGVVEYEPSQTKIFELSNSVVIMTAGDATFQMDILNRVNADVVARIQQDPANWWLVRDVAFLYVRYYNEEVRRRAESAILAPLGLDATSFLQRQRDLEPRLARRLARELIGFEVPETEAIFAGYDPTGPHIFVTTDNRLACHDSVGFAAIGIGAAHANSQFMFSAYSRQKDGPDTLWLAYTAKKRAEAAPGVGRQTDMWGMSGLGSYVRIHPEVIDNLEKIYQESLKKIERANNKTKSTVMKYLTKLAGPTPTQAQPASPLAPQPVTPTPTAAEAPGSGSETSGPTT